ncbi:MAG TPA: DUF1932 domain-containing protein [Gammaproteobacteria bacterium]|nr:DUF1932 domain-containing protein [Gammaproteobacteria bacterium]
MSADAAGTRPVRRVGLLGYGEVGRILAEDLPRSGVEVPVACDLKVGTAREGPLVEHARRNGVRLGRSPDVFEDVDLIFSAVTASETLAAARTCSGHVSGRWFVDVSSASPGTKVAASDAVAGGGGRYVETAFMSTVAARRLAVPLLLGGPFAEAGVPVLRALGFESVRVASARPGVAAATKLCRSVMIKGLEALTLECYSAARAWGVDEAVLGSLADTFPEIDRERRGRYLFQRTMQHGRRRADEMREAARTVAEVGLPGWMCQASARWQDWIAARTLEDELDALLERSGDWRSVADAMLGHWPAGDGSED